MGAVAAQYINLTPLVVYGFLLYFIVPVVACVVAGAVGTGDRRGALRGALCGLLTVMASVAGCSAVMEFSDDNFSFSAFVIQALATAGVGAVVTFWVAGLEFWNN